jgi:hypothetical protein
MLLRNEDEGIRGNNLLQNERAKEMSRLGVDERLDCEWICNAMMDKIWHV